MLVGRPSSIPSTPAPKGGTTTRDILVSSGNSASSAASSHSLRLLTAKCPIPTIRIGRGRIPVREYLVKQGRFAHLIDEDIDYIQGMVDTMWEEWEAAW